MRLIDANALMEYCNNLTGKTIDANDIARFPTAVGWISVKDRLPENDNEVITAYKIDDEKAMKKRKGKLFVKTGNWTGYRWISVWDEYKSYATEEVLYWMPLPKPPKEAQQCTSTATDAARG